MAYVEFLRVRRALVIFAIAIASIELVNLLVHQFGSVVTTKTGAHVGIEIGSGEAGMTPVRDIVAHLTIPLELVFGIAGYAAAFFATIFASSLNKENGYAHFAFTKPISRTRLALEHIGIDAIGILGAFFIVCAAIFVSFAVDGYLAHIDVNVRAFEVAVLLLGVGFMWYGILQAVTASYRGKGGAFVGWSWLVFGVLIGVRDQPFLGPIFGPIVRMLDFFNPFSYAPTISDDHRGAATVSTLTGGPLEAQIALAWGIAIVACAIAVVAWKRVEV